MLQAEIAAINTYFIHAKLLANWGYTKLATKAYEESMDEMKHTEQLVDRIVYFDAIPNLNKIGRVKVGKTVPEQFELALELETGQVERINGAIDDLQRRRTTTARGSCSSRWSRRAKARSTGSRPSSRPSRPSATARYLAQQLG